MPDMCFFYLSVIKRILALPIINYINNACGILHFANVGKLQYPIRAGKMAGVAIGKTFKIILMFGLCLPKITNRF